METKSYKLNEYPTVNGIEFPKYVTIGFALCEEGCGNSEFVVKGSTLICDNCGNEMIIKKTKKYFLSNKRYDCPICEYNNLYYEPYDNGKPSYEICPQCKFQFEYYTESKIKELKKILELM